MKFLARYVRTAAGLRPVQWFYLPLRRLQAILPGRPAAQRVVDRSARLLGAIDRFGVDRPKRLLARADELVDGSFVFMGHRERLPKPDWRRRYISQLWTYHLHYFDYARDLAHAAIVTGDSRYLDRWLDLAGSWVRNTIPTKGDAWQPYPVSIRVVNWSHALALLGERVPAQSRAQLVDSLAQQAGWLERRLEHHIQANHLQKNYFALAVAGLMFEGAAAERWRRMGLEGCWNALNHMVLDDGGHFERSPMYHAIALGDYLELSALCDAAEERVPAGAKDRIRRMVDAFGVLCRDDGRIHLFNDAAHGTAPSRSYLDRLACDTLGAGVPQRVGMLELPETGYFGIARADGARLLIDCGPPGPRHQPAHVHCDLLGFELDIGGEPVVVDSGVHGYAGDRFREYARSTRAHNTVMLGDREQSELWGVFRVARMARVRAARHCLRDDEYRFTGAYVPYHSARLEHRREIVLSSAELTVVDSIAGGDLADLRSFLHFHPRFSVAQVDGTTVLLTSRSGERVRVEWFGVARIRLGHGAGDPEGWYLPEFGRALPAPVIVGDRPAGAGEGAIGYSLRFH